MRLSRISIDNFRGIEHLDLALERDVTVLIGENNSGKTSILEAMRIGLDAIKSDRSVNFTEYDFYRSQDIKELSECKPIKLTFIYEETEEYPWNEQVTQVLNDVIVGADFQEIRLQFTAGFDIEEGAVKQTFYFLDDANNEIVGKKDFLKDLRRLRPFFYQSALRAAKDEFNYQGTFWSSFLNNKSLDQDARQALESELDQIYRRIVDAHTSFRDVANEVKQLYKMVTVGSSEAVSVDPRPADFYRAIRVTEVNVLTDSNARIPIRSHGEGTQSLAVLLLFSAYLKTRLQADVDRLAEPIIAIEEPEAHLHPNAIRALWPILHDLPGQKVIATHSGDILSEVPVESLRRVTRKGVQIECNAIAVSCLNDEESRKFNHHVRRNRGELLFARTWLIVEGETDVSVMVECADTLGIDLHRHGIRVVECSQAGGPALFITVADELGIKWHLVADGDRRGHKYIGAAKALLHGRADSDHISQLSYSNIDVCLCVAGYGEPYLKGLPTQTAGFPDASWANVLDEMRDTYPDKPEQALSVARKLKDRSPPEITAEENTPEYWGQVYVCLKRNFSKPAAAMDALVLMCKPGSPGVPAEIKRILQKVAGVAEISP